jgi:hypothetical protein
MEFSSYLEHKNNGSQAQCQASYHLLQAHNALCSTLQHKIHISQLIFSSISFNFLFSQIDNIDINKYNQFSVFVGRTRRAKSNKGCVFIVVLSNGANMLET